MAALWDLIALPTLNLPAAQASLELGAFVFREGVLTSASAGDIGLHEATLGATIDEPARRALESAGVRVLLGWRAQSLHQSARGFELQGRSGSGGGERRRRERSSAEAVVVALPHTRAAALLEPLLGERAARWRGLGSSPIVNLHVVYDREVMSERFAAGVDTPVQYLFDRSSAAGAPAGQPVPRRLALGRRAGDVDERRRAARALPAGARARCCPRARGARVESSSSRASTPRPSARPPAARPLRPAGKRGARTRARGRVDGDRLAGDARGRGAQRPAAAAELARSRELAGEALVARAPAARQRRRAVGA